jgi:hypothetical protein
VSTDNQAADVVNGIIRAIISGGETAAETYLTALDPALLSIPIVHWLMDQGVHYVAQIVSISGQQFADNIVFDIQTNGEKSDTITAGTALAIAIASGDQGAIQKAKDSAGAAYKKAFQLDGWSTPH